MVFEGPLEMVRMARDANKGANPFKRIKGFNWPGRVCGPDDWAKASSFLEKPWPEAVSMIRYVVDRIRNSGKLPVPKSVKRKPKWSDRDGEVDVDRAIVGDPEYMRQAIRLRLNSPNHVALITNMEVIKGWWSTNPSGVFFRSAAAIAVSEILEEQGYTCEIWFWNRGFGVYPAPDDEQFTACRVKAGHDLTDPHALCDAMSDWFTTNVVFGSYAACPVKPAVSKASDSEGVDAELDWNTIYRRTGL